MKHYLFIIIIFAVSALQAQPPTFKVDCGNDTVYCPRLYPDTLFHLGTQVKIVNGNPPFTYQWSCNAKLKHSTLTASDFLNDTTKLNPYLKLRLNSGLYFSLTIKDKDGNIAIDSVFINGTTFIYSLAEYEFRLSVGDSIQFFYDTFVGGGFAPVKYYWTPSEGLSDSSRIDTWCKPKKSTDYYQYIIDAEGCKCNPNRVYNITVLPTSVVNNPKEPGNSLNLHQDGERLVFINPNGKSANLSFYSVDGKKIYSAQTNDSFIDIPPFIKRKNLKICVLSLMGSIGTLKMY